MTGAENIVNTIRTDARANAAKTLEEANGRVAALRESAQSAQARAEKEALERAKQEAAQRRERRLRMAELDARKQELGKKRELIESAFSGALEQLMAMDDEQKRRLAERVLLSVAEGGEVIHPAKDERFLYAQPFMDKLNQALAAAGKAPVSLAESSCAAQGGFILVGQGVQYDCSYEALLRQMRDELENKVAAILFEE